MKKKIIIIGGGLSGLYLGYLLKKESFSVKILEASDRLGGRIFTKKTNNTPLELGATWLWRYNTELLNLCQELDISLFEQNMNGDALFEAMSANLPQRFQVPPNQEISYRIAGGTSTIIHKLANSFSDDEIELAQKVTKVLADSKEAKVYTEASEFTAHIVISTLPPQLLVNTITFSPQLDKSLLKLANSTHTWMRDSIKFAVTYKTPFWQKHNLSGVGFSNVGPYTEIYDHSDLENQHFALMGFLKGDLVNETKEFREQKVSNQLLKFFGKEGSNYLSYEEKVWSQEKFTNFESDLFLSPHANNGHPIYQKTYLNGKLIIAGSETSPNHGGYMEGAIYRGKQIVGQINE